MKKVLLCSMLIATVSPNVHAMQSFTPTTPYEITHFKKKAEWLIAYQEMLETQAIKTISDEKAQKESHYFNENEEEEYKTRFKKHILKKEGLLNAFNNDEQKLTEQINTWWNEGIKDPRYTYNSYILSDYVDNIVPSTLKQINPSADTANIKKSLQHILTEHLFFSYALPEDQQQIVWCWCPNVSPQEHILALLVMITNITAKHDPVTYTSDNPFIYTGFGSGRLLHDYLALSLLNHHGFKYLRAHLIDFLYDEQKAYCLNPNFKTHFLNTWKKRNSDTMNAYFFSTHKNYLNSYTNKPPKNNVFTLTDPSSSNAIEEQYCFNATRVIFTFINEEYNIKETVCLDFLNPKDINNPRCLIIGEQRCNPNNIHLIQKKKSKEMKNQVDMVIRSIKEKICYPSLNDSLSSHDIITTLIAVHHYLEEYNKTLTDEQKKNAYTVSVDWKRSPRKDFQELIEATANHNSFSYLLNNGTLTIY